MIDSKIAHIEGDGMARAAGRSRRRWSRPVPSPAEMLPAAEVLAELTRVVSSPDFPASPRNRCVLEYLVRTQLEGRWNELTAYHIATRVYGRPATFEPIKDPIVRIEVAKLRRDLEMYYLKSGSRNPLRIAIPRGGYLPQISPAPQGKSGDSVAESFLVSVLRASLCAWSGDREGAVSAWKDLKRADPLWPMNLQKCAAQALEDEKVVRLLVEGALRAGRWADSSETGEIVAG